MLCKNSRTSARFLFRHALRLSFSLSLATTLLSSCSGPAFVSLSLSVCVFVLLFVKSPAFHHEFEQVDVPAEAQLFQEEQEGRQR